LRRAGSSDAHPAHAQAPDGGDHDASVAAAEVVDDVTRVKLGELQHALDDLGRGFFVGGVWKLRGQGAGGQDERQDERDHALASASAWMRGMARQIVAKATT